MEFRTTVSVLSPSLNLGYATKFMSLGSCFAEEIAARLVEYKFNVVLNPFGILYNPASIAKSVFRMLHKTEYTSSELVKKGDLYHSFDHHGKFSSVSKIQTLDKINAAFASGIEALREGDVLIITFGSAQIFEWKATGQVVANCHKYSAKDFVKRRLTVEEIVEEWETVLSELASLNSKCKIIFTVSPVKYFAEGAWENQLSKAVLHLAIEKLCLAENRTYFPAYELVNDELRDYRFYTRDMKHISSEAIDFIFAKFFKQHFTKDTQNLSRQVLALQRQLQHKSLKINSVDNLIFLRKLKVQLEAFQDSSTSVSFKNEIISLQKQIDKI